MSGFVFLSFLNDVKTTVSVVYQSTPMPVFYGLETTVKMIFLRLKSY